MAADASLQDDVVKDPSISSRRNDDVVIRGDIVEFLNKQRCEACQRRGRECIIRFGKEACLLCLDAERPCIFERSVQVRGSAAQVTWDSLLGQGQLLGVADGPSSISDS